MSEALKEDLNINLNSSSSKNIIDYDYPIELGEAMEKSLITEEINGVIKALIITANRNCEIYLSFYGIPISIFEMVDFPAGTQYIPLKIKSLLESAEIEHKYSLSEWVLNNKLEIKVRGAVGTVVNLTIRCSNG